MKNIIKLLVATLLLSGCSTVTHISGNHKIHDTSDIKKGMTVEQVRSRLGSGTQILTVDAWNRYFADDREALGGSRAWLYRRTDITLKKKKLGLIFSKAGLLVEKVVVYD